MKSRCFNTSNKYYKDYGGRGITVCSEWINDISKFYEWSILNGHSSVLTIDRINNDGNYEPSNCRWVGMDVQSYNKRSTIIITINGISKNFLEWSKETGLRIDCLKGRIKRGYKGIEIIKPIKSRLVI
jgi:hypothetical protein